MLTRKISFIFVSFIFALSGISSTKAATQAVRLATYNIEWFGAQGHSSGPNRVPRLKTVIERLNADVIGLEEIADRASLRTIFPATDWQIMIDDQSNDNQNLAIAVRLPFHIVGHTSGSNDIDASDNDFLFPTDDNVTDSLFPRQRDILFAEIQVPDSTNTFTFMVDHPKARVGGRTTTDPRREGAAQQIVQKLEMQFDGKDIVLVGDMNDNPDDRSLNILETGDENAIPGPDDSSDDTFLVNLTEPLLAQDHVSWGLSDANISGGVLNTVLAGSRKTNNDTRGTSGVIAPILFDQILISPNMLSRYTLTSVKVFDDPSAQEGNPPGENPSNTPVDYASDHTPVIAELTIGTAPQPNGTVTPPVVVTQPPLPRVRIIQLLPNPVGDDTGHETVTLKNYGDTVSLADWRLVDKSGNEFDLEGSLASGEQREITLPAGSLPLNNNGDEITLFSDDGVQQDHVAYSAAEVKSGTPIAYGS